MEGTALYLVAALVVCFPASSHSLLSTLITPSVLRVETEEKIVVEAHGLHVATEVNISVLDFPQMKNIMYTIKVPMNPGNGMLVSPSIKVPAKDLKKDSKQNQYVVVQASCPQFTMVKVVLVSFQSGYIFTQTDKTIYTPRSPVRYRVFSVGHNFELLNKSVIVEIETPEGLVVSQVSIKPTSTNIRPYYLPKIASLGTWKVVARFEDSPQYSFSTPFDVKESVLPRFEVTVEPSEMFLDINDNGDFKVSITARFLYGKKVDGVAFVLFGVKIDDEKRSIPESLRRIPIVEGVGEAVLTKAMLHSRFHNLNDLIGHSLYVSVTMMTDSGSDMVVTERTGIKIVTSPYQIHFTKTPKYFKPGMPYEMMVYVTNPDGSPADYVPVVSEPIRAEATTQNDGTAKLILNTPVNSQELSITVKTNRERLPNARQAMKNMVITAYETQGGSGNYLLLSVPGTEHKAGDNLYINFIVRGNNQQVLNQIQYFTYIILTKGKVYKVGRQNKAAGQNLVTMSLPISPAFIPSFRIVAYYIVGDAEIVADSALVDVKDTCMGTLVVKGATEQDNRIHEPGAQMKIKLEGDANAWVGLVAVDKGVYELNKKHKLTQTKVWDTVEKNDIGCTAGSGRNNVGVFEDAGLALQTNVKISTKQRTDLECPQNARRRHRSVQLEGDFEDEFISDEQIISRTDFPESWLWQTEQLTAAPNDQGISSKTVSFYLKDSITTWEVLAVSISDTKGICVAEPYEITVMKDFFIDLQLPYSVVRNEQVEIRAIIYNYMDWDIRVLVELVPNPAVCSASTTEKRYQEVLTIKGQSSRAVPFVMVPWKLGLHDIEVKAAVWGQSVSDGVKKQLKVVPEGLQRKLVKVIELDPAVKGVNGVQEQLVKASILEDIVPYTNPDIKISVLGDLKARIAEDVIDGSKLAHLFISPSGTGEQNMITMTPPVIATLYLDITGQWEKIGVDRRPLAIKQIMQGYTQQLLYKKEDNSYAAFTDRKSSTWLTAYVVKVFAMASKIVNTIDNQVFCGDVTWLIGERQKPDGTFHEVAPVIRTDMMGGYNGVEQEVSLTAFVLVALLESKEICKDHINILKVNITKATDYLSRMYRTLQRPYTTALTAYALALAGQLNDDRVLMAASTGGNRWEEYNARTYNIEGTSYSLLALLKMEKFDNIGPIVNWLKEQKYYGDTKGQTQATIMVFQALGQYKIDIASHKDLNLNVSIILPQCVAPFHFWIDSRGALLNRTVETTINKDFTVQASGQGKATMTVVTVYNKKPGEDAAQCKRFHLDITVQTLNLTDKEAKGSQGAVTIKICTRYLGEVDATMSIIDVSMLTGFAPDTEDLKRLSNRVDRYISKFEADNVMSERGNVIIYLDKISHTEDECLQFKAYQYFQVGYIQPASVKVYSYYNLDEQCTKFYHPDKGSSLLRKICYDDVCRCAEESCSLLNKAADLLIRIELACKPTLDYVYKAKLIRTEEANGYDNYVMEVLEIIKAGSDPNPQASPRTFISQMKCRAALNLEENKDYLIWGPSTDMLGKSNLSYVIGKYTWIERWPNYEECQEKEFQNLCADLIQFSNMLKTVGCRTEILKSCLQVPGITCIFEPF